MNSPSIGSSRRRPIARGIAFAAIAALLGGCAGGGSGTMPAATHAAAPSDPQGTARVTFTMHWNAATQSVKRTPKYVPATAESVAIGVNGGVAQYINYPATTISIDAPVGTDTFTFATYDEPNGVGNILSFADVTQEVVPGTANVVTAVLNGVIASLLISLQNPPPPAGAAASINVFVQAKDADGNLIIGSTNYNTAIKLTATIPAIAEAGALSFSSNSISSTSPPPMLQYNGATLTTATITASAAGVTSVSTTFAPVPTFYQYSIPTSTNRPQWIAAGSDGNMWFTESPGNKVARIQLTGVVTEFTIPTANANPQGIIGASDGNLWFTEYASSKIGRLTTSGTFIENGTLFGGDGPQLLVDRGDGNVWYTGLTGDHIGYQGISSGVSGETTLPTAGAQPYGIATAPDNNLYITQSASGADGIARINNLFGTVTSVALPSGTHPLQIVRGPDGNLWFTENGTNLIGRLSPNSFTVTGNFPTVTPNSNPTGIVVGQDNALWFTETGLDRIGRVTTGGVMTEYTSPVTGLNTQGIAVGPDGSLWFAEPGNGITPGRVGRLVY